MVNLSAYANEQVTATLRDGRTIGCTVWETEGVCYPYLLDNRTYTESGLFYMDESSDFDIVSIRAVNQPNPEPNPEPSFAMENTVCVARFGNTILCAFPTRDLVKKYLKAEHSEIDPYDIAITPETLKGAT